MVEQVECRVQLQHLSTSSQTRLLEQLTVEPILNILIGVYPFLFCPPDGPAAIKYIDTPPDIARPYPLQLEIVAGLSHQELTPLAHTRRPLARWRPHLHRVACVRVC